MSDFFLDNNKVLFFREHEDPVLRVINEDSHTYSSRLEGNHLLLRKKCPNTEFFWSAFSRIQTKYGYLLRVFPYLD